MNATPRRHRMAGRERRRRRRIAERDRRHGEGRGHRVTDAANAIRGWQVVHEQVG